MNARLRLTVLLVQLYWSKTPIHKPCIAFKNFHRPLNFALNLTDTQKSKSLICHLPLFRVKLAVRGENIQINVVENDQKGHVFFLMAFLRAFFCSC